MNPPFSEENVFIVNAVAENDEGEINGAIGVMDSFFSIEPESRKKAVEVWIELLTNLLEDELVVELAGEVYAGEMAIMLSNKVIEKKEIPDNVVLFKRPIR